MRAGLDYGSCDCTPTGALVRSMADPRCEERPTDSSVPAGRSRQSAGSEWLHSVGAGVQAASTRTFFREVPPALALGRDAGATVTLTSSRLEATSPEVFNGEVLMGLHLPPRLDDDPPAPLSLATALRLLALPGAETCRAARRPASVSCHALGVDLATMRPCLASLYLTQCTRFSHRTAPLASRARSALVILGSSCSPTLRITSREAALPPRAARLERRASRYS
jgi:hypothetical protein